MTFKKSLIFRERQFLVNLFPGSLHYKQEGITFFWFDFRSDLTQEYARIKRDPFCFCIQKVKKQLNKDNFAQHKKFNAHTTHLYTGHPGSIPGTGIKKIGNLGVNGK